MFQQQDFDLAGKEPPQTTSLIRDLELEVMFDAMSSGDPFLHKVARAAVLTSLDSVESIQYRQAVLEDCLRQPAVVRETYGIAVEALEREKKIWGWSSMRRQPDSSLHRSVEVLQLFVSILKRLRRTAEQHAGKFRSEGFTALFKMLMQELDDQYLHEVEAHLGQLAFRAGLVMSAELGSWNKGSKYTLNRSPDLPATNWWDRLQAWVEGSFGPQDERYVYQIADRDEAGFRALAELRNRGIARVAAALVRSTSHILSFFEMLRLELAFYVACLNLHEKLGQKGEAVCMPKALPAGDSTLIARGLYDVCLSLSFSEQAVPNDVDGKGKRLVMITGANRGGKSTFLRAIGQAQLMMQCGLFVGAQQFRVDVCSGLFTHYKREEDSAMKSGKLDEELGRMSAIVRQVKANGVVLLNESFGSTNEREGSEIARGIVRALIEKNIKVFYVTHLFHLAQSFWRDRLQEVLFLRAERLQGGKRTFRVLEGEPLSTSFGEDLFQRIFGVPIESRPSLMPVRVTEPVRGPASARSTERG
jgi:DNA mismatch repair ATPase MutS